jgi:hypothetical protein
MTDASLPPSSTGRRRAAREREYRRLRILAMAPAGSSYAAIGSEAAISGERAPQIVASPRPSRRARARPRHGRDHPAAPEAPRRRPAGGRSLAIRRGRS